MRTVCIFIILKRKVILWKENFLFIFQAYDLGKPAKFEFKLFEISIIDIDDNAPKFNQSSYTFKVLEGQGVGKEVGRVEAVDPDVNSCVTYQSSTSEPYSEIFEVDPHTGIISTKKDFDFETEIQKEFYFEVYASSCESPQKLDFVRANIQLIDDNDNRYDWSSKLTPPHLPDTWVENSSFFEAFRASDIFLVNLKQFTKRYYW